VPPIRIGAEDLPELLPVDEQEHERAIVHTGDVSPLVGRYRRARNDGFTSREHDGHFDVAVVNTERKRRLVVQPLDHDRLIAADGLRVDPGRHTDVLPNRELRLVRDLNHVLRGAEFHA